MSDEHKPLTQKELNHVGCDNPDCDHTSPITNILPKCHPNAGVDVAYHKERGTIMIRCHRCKGGVQEIAVDNGPVDLVGPPINLIPIPPPHFQN